MNIEQAFCMRGVLFEVGNERHRQHAKWGQQDRTPFEWCTILGEEFGEACKAVVDVGWHGGSWDRYREELIHTAAVAIQAIECFDRGIR